MMKKQFNWMRQQLSYPSGREKNSSSPQDGWGYNLVNIISTMNQQLRGQETADYLTEDLLQVEQRIEPVKRAAHNVHKRLVACLQGQYGAELDKRVKKLPLMALSVTMAESFKELDTDSSLGKALEMSCCIQSMLARILAEFEITLEQDVLQPLNKLSEEELPVILKHKKNLQKHILDWNSIKSRLNQVAKNSNNSVSAVTTSGASSAALKLENLKEEEEEMKRRVEQSKDEYMADLYHFSTKEDSYAKYFIKLLEIQAEYHQKSLESLNSSLAELMSSDNQTDAPFPLDAAVPGVYGMPLETHLKAAGREIALPIEACVMMLLTTGMREEGLFRLAAGASVLKKLKYYLDSGSNILDEFYVDPHAVAGALKCYLRELPQPLMTSELYDDWLKAASAKEPEVRLECLKDVCNLLPKDNYNNMRYLIRFLAKLAEQQEVNKMSPSNIAIVLGPNLLWPQENERSQVQLDMASVSSIQVVGVVEPLIQNAEILFPGDIDFNVSSLFTPPLDIKNQNISTTEEPTAVFLPLESNPPIPEERKNAEVIPETVSSKVTQSSTETTICPPTSLSADETSRKTKRVAPPRPTVPPPHPQTTPPVHRNMAPPPPPESPSIPKALPRRTVGGPARAPGVPPPLPPQPARRQSLKALPSPRPPSEATNNKAAAAEEDSTKVCSRETPKDSVHTKKEANERKNSSPAAASQNVEAPENVEPPALQASDWYRFLSPSRERRASDWLRLREEDGRGGRGVGGECSSSMAGCKRLSGACLREVLDEAQGLLFDCDGVLWTGERAVPGAPELMERLNQNGKITLFVSNNSRRSVAELERRFSRLGFRGVRGEQVFSSALCSALYLRKRLLGGEAGDGDSAASTPGRVFVLGGEGLRGELRDAGLRLTDEEGDGDEEPPGQEGLPVRAVVVGYDDQFTFAKLSEACAYLRDPRCLLVATDPDPWHPLSSGQRTPGTGSLTAAVETASGRKATVIGKPNTYMFECIVERFGVDPSRMLMVGDRLETDILFGKNCGLDTVLTLTGVSHLEEAQAYMASDSPSAKDLVPHYYVDSIADLIPGLDE
ncbi:PREDICTED: SH3 domain-binding protein 1 [Thamnophis sirtalis]|uniref:Chronophin n=1 Tax=Thamnophis sirtalis TaxID=35019 RepID=A0A6I9XTC9_9SAUR|nr:PREDICTED: SH3 domain-binding protein 1 [Thamnophis sirtalis]